MMQSKQIKAWALCWPDDDRPMLYLDRDEAEDDLKWFTKNDKNVLNAQPPGEPFIVELSGRAPEAVHVEWKYPDLDWHWFYLLETRGEWVKLQGRDSPDGDKHDGDVFWVYRSEMKTMQVELDAQQE